ncbi:MAG: DUF5309 family protein, partial [Clostridia bacterium]|nr:DUF5309 family protein [Clostridia bacterium]
SPTKTPFLSAIGGMSGGKVSESDEFITGQEYELPDAAQPEISETDSETAPTATAIVREQKTNVTQIFHESVAITYAKMANRGKLAGLNLAGQKANPVNEKDWQIALRLKKIARDMEHTFLNGTYQKSDGAAVANKTRGMLELCSTGTTIDLNNSALTLAKLNELYKAMADAGAPFRKMALECNSTIKQIITAFYEKQLGYNAPAARNSGGMNVTHIETDFFELDITYNPKMPQSSLLIADLAVCAPVFTPVPGKGVLFYEELAKSGAAEKGQLFGMVGLDHGPQYAHASITGIKVA